MSDTKLIAIYDPNWGEPVPIPETIRESEELAWEALAKMSPPHSVHVSLGRVHLMNQGYKAHYVSITKGEEARLFPRELTEEARKYNLPATAISNFPEAFEGPVSEEEIVPVRKQQVRRIPIRRKSAD